MESTAAGMEVDSAPRGAATTQNASAEQALSLPWVEKYRPNQLSDLCSHEEIISTLNKLMSGGHLPNLLFYGPPGTGKTSTVLACAKQMYGDTMNSMVLELNACDDRSVGPTTEISHACKKLTQSSVHPQRHSSGAGADPVLREHPSDV